MRFFQLFNVYEACLETIYRRHPGLEALPHAAQMEKVWDFGFSSGYLYAPYLRALGMEAHFAVANSPVSQLAWAREHGINLQYPDAWMYEVAVHQVNYYKPDVLFITEPLALDSRFIRLLHHRPKVVLGWRASIIPAGTDWSEFDIILTNLSAIRQVALRLGAKSSAHFWPGFERRLYERVKDEPLSCDLVFAGQWTRFHKDRNQILVDLVEADEQNSLGFESGIFVSGPQEEMHPGVRRRNRGVCYGVDYYRALRSGGIALDARGTLLDIPDPITGKPLDLFRGETGTNRMLEVTGVGRMLMAEHYDNLNQYFELGREMETFRSFDDLVEKVRHYKNHPEEREAIARRGHERCLREHSMEVRVGQLNDLIHGYLRGKSVHANRSKEMEAAVARCRELLAAMKPELVLGILEPYLGESQVVRDLFFVRAQALAELGRVFEAISDLERELLVYPDHEGARTLMEQLPNKPVKRQASSPSISQELVASLIG